MDRPAVPPSPQVLGLQAAVEALAAVDLAGEQALVDLEAVLAAGRPRTHRRAWPERPGPR